MDILRHLIHNVKLFTKRVLPPSRMGVPLAAPSPRLSASIKNLALFCKGAPQYAITQVACVQRTAGVRAGQGGRLRGPRRDVRRET